ncbi:hypothetical protein B296_00031817 [Ensete ventricosum]|uniref:Uncharacterized protein n=1 Tax=Ensete ventricosum TaxID=4639 RepID=A0A426XAY0_ENSVE|nr:hypothetical protein B296_00031817 [Ensete ventricosum]
MPPYRPTCEPQSRTTAPPPEPSVTNPVCQLATPLHLGEEKWFRKTTRVRIQTTKVGDGAGRRTTPPRPHAHPRLRHFASGAGHFSCDMIRSSPRYVIKLPPPSPTHLDITPKTGTPFRRVLHPDFPSFIPFSVHLSSSASLFSPCLSFPFQHGTQNWISLPSLSSHILVSARISASNELPYCICRLFGNREQRKERNDEPGVDRLKQRRQWIRKISDNNKKRTRMGCGSMVGSERCVSCTTFNILAPIYKRLSEEASSRFSFFVSSLPFFLRPQSV